MSDTPLRVAFLGAGRMARQHLQLVSRRRDAAVVGVFDPVPGQAGEFASLAGTQAYPSVASLMTDARPEIVHVCTPPASHFEAACAALDAGAHVYVEKPFACTVGEARELLERADRRGVIVCPGHQLLRDPAFETLLARAGELGALAQADSHFAFRPVQIRPGQNAAAALADQLIDVLPHPLYTLVAALESRQPAVGAIELAWAQAGATDLHAILRAGDVTGRLSVSLRARPVASSLSVIGTSGSLTCDFVRSIVVGCANPGTEALEKILNPVIEGTQLVTRTTASLGRRLSSAVAYPGLGQLIDAFYRAAARGGESPVPPAHLLRVTGIFEELVRELRSVSRTAVALPAARQAPEALLAVVTGAGGWLGREVARAMPRVRGIGRGPAPEDPPLDEWITADLSNGVPAGALAGAQVVVHAAAETAGGYDAHQRNTIDATRQLLCAMAAAGVPRLVLVSSLSVLRPPRTPWERQDERTPLPAEARRFGAYAWGKCEQEKLVERETKRLGIELIVVRPAALIHRDAPDLPGLAGRRLFGRWHLGIGRPGLPVAVCDLTRCAEAIAWCATHFDEAPPVVNLVDPALATRGEFVASMRTQGWNGRLLWVPVSVVALGLMAARTALSLAHGRWPEPLAAWSVLRPRRYDTRVSAWLLDTSGPENRTVRPLPMALTA